MWTLGFLTFNSKTLITTWVTMAVVLCIAIAGTRTMSETAPRGLQNIMEFMVDFVNGFLKDLLDEPRGRRMRDLLVTMLLFLVVANLIGLLPGWGFIQGVNSPTADPNTAFALAALVFILTHFYGFRFRGFTGHAGSFFRPYVALYPVNALESVTNPLTLAMRLFGNIFAGELLIDVFLNLFKVGSAAWLISIPVQVFWLFFAAFIAVIQAFIFMMLTMNYIGTSMLPPGEH